ncbi:MAG: glycosyltransferase [Dorea sp.]|nr:glycosyltransferase [Dorea sp.]
MGSVKEAEPYFSIVMPTFGVENYIAKAIKSIQKQDYPDWEIIVVDDCSPDKSARIAERAAETDERIRIVHHKENQGLSAARNTGIEEAKGKYVWFMDPDDYVDSDILRQVKASLEENQAEVVMFGLNEEYYDKKGSLQYTHSICPSESLYVNQEELRKAVIHLERQTLYGYAWNKIYNLEYIKKNRLKYKNVKLIEDIVFNIQFFMDIKRLNILGIAPYHYAKRLDANLTNKFVPEYFAVHRKRIELLYHQHLYWGMCTEEVREILGSLYGRYIFSALERNCDERSGMRMVQRMHWCRRLFKQELFCELIPAAKAEDSRILAMALIFLQRKRACLCLLMGRGIYIVRKYLPMIYSKIKSGR